MAFNYSPKIVTGGLLLYMDIANSKSYFSGSATWKDLTIQNYNGTLTNSPGYNSSNAGSVVFDGTNDYVNTNFTSQLNDFTACAWFKDNTTVEFTRIIDKNFQTGFWMGRGNGGTSYWGGGVKQTLNYNFINLDSTNWHYLVMVRTGTSLKVYGDGITNTNTTVCGDTAIGSTALSIGAAINDGLGQRDFFKGNIALVQIYNRTLSTSEILQNYNALKPRFGL